MKHLFVGGPYHGRFLEVRSGYDGSIFAPLTPLITAADVENEPDDNLFISVCEYKRQSVGGCVVYVADRTARR
jgi:hypothetical protein